MITGDHRERLLHTLRDLGTSKFGIAPLMAQGQHGDWRAEEHECLVVSC